MGWYKELADNSDIVIHVESIGKSYEGRDQPAIHIVGKDDADMRIYFQCQIHARKAHCLYQSLPQLESIA